MAKVRVLCFVGDECVSISGRRICKGNGEVGSVEAGKGVVQPSLLKRRGNVVIAAGDERYDFALTS